VQRETNVRDLDELGAGDVTAGQVWYRVTCAPNRRGQYRVTTTNGDRLRMQRLSGQGRDVLIVSVGSLFEEWVLVEEA